MNYKVLDIENGVASCSCSEIPDNCRKDIVKHGGELAEMTFYYDRDSDLVVLNEDHRYFEQYREMVTGLIKCSDHDLLNMFDKLPDDTKTEFMSMFEVLITIKRYRMLKGDSGHSEE